MHESNVPRKIYNMFQQMRRDQNPAMIQGRGNLHGAEMTPQPNLKGALVMMSTCDCLTPRSLLTGGGDTEHAEGNGWILSDSRTNTVTRFTPLFHEAFCVPQRISNSWNVSDPQCPKGEVQEGNATSHVESRIRDSRLFISAKNNNKTKNPNTLKMCRSFIQ